MSCRCHLTPIPQAGLTVTTHERRISVNGYTGEGYIILNDRGTGAWMINGGLYGGVIILGLVGLLILILAPTVGMVGAVSGIGAVAAIGIGILFMSAAASLASGKREWCVASLFAAVWIFKKFFITRFFNEKVSHVFTFLGILPGADKIYEMCGCKLKPVCYDIPSLNPLDYLK